MKTKYKNVTKIISDNLLESAKIIKNRPILSYKFGSLSLYYDGMYYFPSDIKENEEWHRKAEEGHRKPYKIQVVYYQGKWYQDTCYITKEFVEFLLFYTKGSENHKNEVTP
jgi:hypothetical protein